MLPSWCNDTITVIRPGTTTSRGSTVPDWLNTLTHDISGCSVQPATTSLSQDGRVLGVSEGLTIYMPPDADIQAGDRITWQGDTYQVMGEPKRWRSATDRVSSCQISVERWRG